MVDFLWTGDYLRRQRAKVGTRNPLDTGLLTRAVRRLAPWLVTFNFAILSLRIAQFQSDAMGIRPGGDCIHGGSLLELSTLIKIRGKREWFNWQCPVVGVAAEVKTARAPRQMTRDPGSDHAISRDQHERH